MDLSKFDAIFPNFLTVCHSQYNFSWLNNVKLSYFVTPAKHLVLLKIASAERYGNAMQDARLIVANYQKVDY